MNVLDLLQQSGIATKKVAGTHGGEYAGPCPLCGGTDRFRAWPELGRWWCRGCGKGGDAIQFLRDVRGLGFREACSVLGHDPGDRKGPGPARPEWTPRAAALPSETWRAAAEAFVAQAQEALAGDPGRLAWLQEERGLSADTARAARLGWNPTDLYLNRASWGLPEEQNAKGTPKRLWLPAGLVIPAFAGDGDLTRLKIRRPGGDGPRYVHVSGSSSGTWILPDEAARFTVVESELDGLLLHQEARDLTGVVVLGSAQARPDTAATALLRAAETVLVALDSDAAGAKEAWAWWAKHFPNAKRWPCPRGKDLTEAWRAGVPLRAWIEGGFAEEAKKRQATSGPGVYGGKPLMEQMPQGVAKARDQAGKPKTVVEQMPQVKARDQAGSLMGVSGRYVSEAKALTDPVAQAVDQGEPEGVSVPVDLGVDPDNVTDPLAEGVAGDITDNRPATEADTAQDPADLSDPDPGTADVLAWIDGVTLPAVPFRLRRGETVVNPERFLAGLRHDIQAGRRGPRARVARGEIEMLRGIVQ